MDSNSQSPQNDAPIHKVGDDVAIAPTRDPQIAFNEPQLPAVNPHKGHDAMVLTEKEVDSADEGDERDVKKGQVGAVSAEINLDETDLIPEIPWETPSVARLPVHWCHLWRHRYLSALRLFLHLLLRTQP